MAINFPNSPSNNQIYIDTASNATFRYNSLYSVWNKVTSGYNVTNAVSNFFSANGSQNTFSLTNSVLSQNNTLVTIDGLVQAPGVHYNISGATLRFTYPPTQYSIVEVRNFESGPMGGGIGYTGSGGTNGYTGSTGISVIGDPYFNQVALSLHFEGANGDIKTYDSSTNKTSVTVVQSVTVNAAILAVAGGGGGGVGWGGGGGAGGLIVNTYNLAVQNYTVVVGAGGAGGTGLTVQGANGVNTSIIGSSNFSLVAIGGGGGGSWSGTESYPVSSGPPIGKAGGSGGGASSKGNAGGSGLQPTTASGGSGNAGGPGASNNSSYDGGGGGGGAGSVGGTGGGSGGAGGSGVFSNISGTNTAYAGGGGAGSTGAGGAGGSSIGGTGGTGTAGTANTGSGGGGLTGSGSSAGQGGSGIVWISYPGSQIFYGGVVSTLGSNTLHLIGTSTNLVPLAGSNAYISTAVSKFGNSSFYTGGQGSAYTQTTAASSGLDLSSASVDWTIETWVYPLNTPSTESYSQVIGWGGGNGLYPPVSLSLSNTGLWTAQWNALGIQSADANVTYSASLNTWTHLALAKQSNTVRLFVNGVLANTGVSNSIYGIYQSTSGWYMGSGSNGSYRLNGYLDDVRITKGIARYTSTFTPPTTANQDYVVGALGNSGYTGSAGVVATGYTGSTGPTGTFTYTDYFMLMGA